jgi:hypothetical protein
VGVVGVVGDEGWAQQQFECGAALGNANHVITGVLNDLANTHTVWLAQVATKQSFKHLPRSSLEI